MNVQDAAIQILKDAGKPLHAKEIAERIMEAGLWSSDGKTPEATVSACLYSNIKKHGDQSTFVKVAPQTFFLRDTQIVTVCDVKEEAPAMCRSEDPVPYGAPPKGQVMSFLQAGDLAALENMIRENQWALNVVFTKVWLKFSDSNRRRLYLSEMEKRFISHRKYDLTVSHSEKVLGSLAYFDADSDSIVLLRRIRANSSSKYCCDVIECRLEDTLMLPTTGEFVEKGEHASYKKRKIRKERFDKKVADKKAEKEIRRPDDCWIDIVTGREIRSSEPVKSDDQRWGTCEICGDYTNYWWSFDDSNLICKCKKCSGGGQNEEV